MTSEYEPGSNIVPLRLKIRPIIQVVGDISALIHELTSPIPVRKYSESGPADQQELIEITRRSGTLFFDLDDTLVESKTPLGEEFGALFSEILEDKKVVINTGGTFETTMKNFVSCLPDGSNLRNLTLLPLFGLEQYSFDEESGAFEKYNTVSEHVFPDHVLKILNSVITEVLIEDPSFQEGYRDIYGDDAHVRHIQQSIIQARGDPGETFNYSVSLLGQSVPSEFQEYKAKFDTDKVKRSRIIEAIKEELKTKLPPEDAAKVSLSTGGATSIDITWGKADKYTGISSYLKGPENSTERAIGIMRKGTVFFGDSMGAGGNDHEATRGGMQGVWISGPEQTFEILSMAIAKNK